MGINYSIVCNVAKNKILELSVQIIEVIDNEIKTSGSQVDNL